MNPTLRVLLAEDNPHDCELVLEQLRQAGYEPEWQRVETEPDFIAAMRPELDLIISDYVMPQFSGLHALELVKARGLEVPFVIVSGTIGEDLATEAMRRGAADYFLKDRLVRLGQAVGNLLEASRQQQQVREAERAMVASAEFARDILNSLSAEVVVLDEHGRITATNNAWNRFARENGGFDYHGQNYLEICAHAYQLQDDHLAGSAWNGIAKVLKGELPAFLLEYPCNSPTEARWFQMRVTPLTGTARGVVVAHEQITERKKIEESLRIFRSLVDQSSESFEVVDPVTARYLDVNDRGCEMLGYEREELLQLSVQDVDTEVASESWTDIIALMRKQGFIHRDSLHRRRKDGTTFPIELTARLVHIDRDYVVAVVRDISERRMTEQHLREQSSMLDAAHDAIMVRGFHDRKLTYWNRGAAKQYGWTAEEAIGRDISEFLTVDPRGPDDIRDALLKSDEWSGETEHRTKAGQVLTVYTRATLMRDASGAPRAVLSINTDITEHKKLEAQFLRAQRMESIGTLASGVAHDLNNILSPIMMSVPMLRMDLTPEQREEIVTTIEMSAERGAQIVKQVLTFGRGLQGQKLPLDLKRQIKDLAKIIRETFPKDIQLTQSVDQDLWSVTGDATQVHQVLLNLCVNARDAMPGGGRLSITASNVEVDANYSIMLMNAKPGPYVLIEVADSGIGIPVEIQERIFDPFFTTKELGKGTGLGLSTVLGLVKGHGGVISLSSAPGMGSTFQIFLPAIPVECEGAEESQSPAPPRGAGELILVVDDEEPVTNAARTVLTSFGYEVLLARDGTEALAVFAQQLGKIALVLTDLMMPYMDGLTLIRTLRRLQADIPIVASTGLGEKAQLNELRNLGVETVLHKPYNARMLVRTVADTLRSSG